MVTNASTSIVDTLNGLLEGHHSSVFPFVLSNSDQVRKANPEIRALLNEAHEVCGRQAHELIRLIESLGGKPRVTEANFANESYLSFLSLKFLLPALVNEKDLLLQRYENARASVGEHDSPEVHAELKRIEDEQCELLGRLKQAASEVTGGKFEPPSHSDRCGEPAK